MHLNVRDEHRARIDEEARAIDDMAAQLRVLRAQCEAAAFTLADAQRSLENLQSETQRLEARHSLASACLSQSRADFVRSFLTTMPDDILRCIFEEVAALPDEGWETIGDGTYNEDRAMHPFLLASVCARWRRVALALPGLWTYVGISDEESSDDVAQHIARVPLFLSRSKTAPLDIFVHLYHFDAALTSVMATLAAHASRWRRVQLSLPSGTPRGVVDGFKGPMLHLIELSIAASFDEDDEGFEGYFPHTPRLGNLSLCGTLMFLSRFCATPPPLTTLRITVDYSCVQLVRLLELVQNTLEALHITLGFTDTPTSPIKLPMLHTLLLGIQPFFVSEFGTALIAAPKLRSLSAKGMRTFHIGIRPLLEQHSRTVTELALQSLSVQLDSRIIPSYDCLVNLSVVHFMTVPRGSFFAHIATSSAPCIWPRLEHIILGFSGNCDSECYDGLLLLLATRNRHTTTAHDSGAASDADSARPCKIRRIDLPEDAPSWVTTEVKRLLSL